MFKRMWLKFQRWQLERERQRLFLSFAGTGVQNLDEFLHEYDLRIAEIDAKIRNL